MRAPISLAALAFLLAGCAASSPNVDEAPTDEDAGRQSTGGGGDDDNATRVWEHVIDWQLEASPAPAVMVVPGNLSSLWVVVHDQPGPPANCGTNVGDPLAAEAMPVADFVSPSGVATRIALFANECQAGTVSVTSGSGNPPLEGVEPGSWQVIFSGRGAGLQQRLVVEGQAG